MVAQAKALSINLVDSGYLFYIFNGITEPYFRIDFGQTSNYGEWMEATAMNGMYKIAYGYNGKKCLFEDLII
ncbi:Hypothetical predicted protein [Octopus vulgaris]|uniref:Uncharacterized protein n=1 Tax=Octopus vulgaris TaxID=6645 RepID=A0AA36B463_OCTVU|nr:Hypothetical predicted protein [Octopus vulgaris]